MEVSQVASATTSYATAAQSGAGSIAGAAANAIDSNQFLSLLMAQLTHQNPLEPLKDAEMLSQFAQLNSVEELKNIRTLMSDAATSNQTGYAASLIGKNICAATSSTTTLEGLVTGITMESGKVYVHVGEEQALLSDVIEIKG